MHTRHISPSPKGLGNPLHRITNYLFKKLYKTNYNLAQLPPDSKERYSYQLTRRRINMSRVEQKDLIAAITAAEDPVNPRRFHLYSIYKESLRDVHLLSQMETAILKVIGEPWMIVDKKTLEPNLELTQLLQTEWFEEVGQYYIESFFWGHSLIEFQQLVNDPDGRGLVFDAVKLFPREHVIPEAQMVVGYPDAVEGLDYTNPEIGQWFLEAGKPDNLGLLSPLSKYTIYGKYGIGQWSGSNEKWADPLLIVRSASDSDAENDKKAEFAAEFGENGWAIFDKEDELELLERSNGTGFQTFPEFLRYINDMVSKGVNGQVGTSDDRAYVGAAEVQERLLGEYTERRLRKLFYFHNTKTLPYLINVAGGRTAYSALNGYGWMPERFHPENKATKRGDTDPQPDDNPQDTDPNQPQNRSGREGLPGKKYGYPIRLSGANLPGRINTTSKMENPYKGLGCSCTTESQTVKTDVQNIGLDRIATKAIKRVYKRRVRKGQVHQGLTQAQALELWESVREGLNNNVKQSTFGSKEHLLYQNLKYNVHVFSAFKNHHNVLEMHALLFDGEEKIKPRYRFVKDAKELNKTWLGSWLNTEQALAKANARMASKWMVIEGKDVWIVYKAVKDGRTRDEHRKLDGMTKKADDPIWDRYFPPNDYGCRCYIITKNNAVDTDPKELPELKPMFAHNPGKLGRIFNGEHPFFLVDSEHREKAINLFGYRPPINREQFLKNMDRYKALKENPDYSRISADHESGGYVFKHKGADKKDLPKNVVAANKLAKDGYAVEIREHVNIDSLKNPELLINNVVSDLKAGTGKKAVKNAFTSASKQRISTVTILVDDMTLTEAAAQARAGFKFNDRIQRAIFLIKGRVVEVSRADYESGIILEKLKA